MAPIAIAEIIVTSIIALFPTVERRHAVGSQLRVEVRQLHADSGRRHVLLLLCIYWHASVKKWFTGPIKQIDAIEPEPEPEAA